MKRLSFAALTLWLICSSAHAQEVDANLVTALDVSSSINAQETMLQIEGVAEAIRSPAVVSAIQNGKHGRIGFTVFVWADGDYPELVAWRAIGTQDDADAAAAEILAKLQGLLDASSRSVGTLTNLSGALDHSADLLKAAPYRADRLLVNIVGNGEDNVGEDPQRARADLVASGVTVNGVVIGSDPAVLNYYRTQVVGGRGAFVFTVDKAEAMTGVMASKFINEIAMR